MKHQQRTFMRQFADVPSQKLARRERFLRKMAGRRQHLRARLHRQRPGLSAS